MADHSIDDIMDFNVDQIDIYEFLNSDPPLTQSPNHQKDVIGGTIDKMYDPSVQSLFENGSGSNEASGPGTNDKNVGQIDQSFPVLEEFQLWPVPAVPVSCSFCQVLREIVHTNGIYSTKLEIHGRVGMISHAILVTRISSGEQAYQMLNLSKKSIERVKEFLIHYCGSRKHAGFVLVDDPMAPFYEALCVGLDLSDSYGYSDDEIDPPSGSISSPSSFYTHITSSSAEKVSVDQCSRSDTAPTNHHGANIEAANQAGSSLPRSGPPMPTKSHRSDFEDANQISSSDTRTWYQKQRDRAANLTAAEVSGYFHLTLSKAARHLRVGTTVVKNFCRRHRMPRWPYRKIKGIETKISDQREVLQRTLYVDQQRLIEAEIARLQREIEEIYIRFGAS